MRRFLFPAFAVLLLAGLAVAQNESEINSAPPQGITVDQIIQKFAAREAEFKQARENYTYHQEVKVQTLDGDTVDGEYRQDSDILFDPQGRRAENVTFAPQSTLQKILMTPEDEQDIRQTMPFVLTTVEIPEYDIKYVGQQHVDELDTYVFDVAPRHIDKNKRYFQGRIWVDGQDLQIVMTKGRPVPETRKGRENLFPKFTTWREQVDGRYWFPTYTRADDFLQFSAGPVHVREIIKYTDYKRFGANTKITYEGQEIQKDKQGQPQQPQQPPK
jgi:hypothetical protein